MRGLTLLELVIAVFILSLGSLAAIRATDQSRLAIGGEPSRIMAMIVARNRVQELQLYGASGAGRNGRTHLPCYSLNRSDRGWAAPRCG